MPNVRSRSHILRRVSFLAWWRATSEVMTERGLPPLTYGEARSGWWKLRQESRVQDYENKQKENSDD